MTTKAPPDASASRKNPSKTSFLMAVVGRVLFPDSRIRRNRAQIVKILRPKRPELEQRARQRGLEFERHP